MQPLQLHSSVHWLSDVFVNPRMKSLARLCTLRFFAFSFLSLATTVIQTTTSSQTHSQFMVRIAGVFPEIIHRKWCVFCTCNVFFFVWNKQRRTETKTEPPSTEKSRYCPRGLIDSWSLGTRRTHSAEEHLATGMENKTNNNQNKTRFQELARGGSRAWRLPAGVQ